ncbi:CstA-like transporter-associated (seleno)protein [Amycolatopsis sp. MtRt-6]|uniref:CstA-like transporter-associated (seleno)protein n=1 Tax=Amycolatopsis sp. MtRt-6 TaxID=2792782 RepID=UPI001A903E55|nr:CstA-like transporter-associated (seleno)protein [Amycolatopsis sp. MtRt-6]
MKVLRLLRWYVREIGGAAEYERHCARARAQCPDRPVPTRRAYELERLRRREGRPPDRCC